MSCVYCIQQGVSGPVKIGWTSHNPVVRLQNLQTGNPEPLKLLGVIRAVNAREIEEALHDRLIEHWIRAEWFHAHDDVFAAFDEARGERGFTLAAERSAA